MPTPVGAGEPPFLPWLAYRKHAVHTASPSPGRSSGQALAGRLDTRSARTCRNTGVLMVRVPLAEADPVSHAGSRRAGPAPRGSPSAFIDVSLSPDR